MAEKEKKVTTWAAFKLTWPRIGALEVLPIALAVIALLLSFGLLEPRFLRTANLINVLRNSAYLMIISSGQMLVLIIGGFDLSVGAVVALTSVTTALSMVSLSTVIPDTVGLVIALGVLAALITGAAVGFFNGFCVALLKVNPFIVTLGTLSLASGIALYATTGVPSLVHRISTARTATKMPVI